MVHLAILFNGFCITQKKIINSFFFLWPNLKPPYLGGNTSGAEIKTQFNSAAASKLSLMLLQETKKRCWKLPTEAVDHKVGIPIAGVLCDKKSR